MSAQCVPQLAGYFGGKCPNGDGIHLSPVFVSSSAAITDLRISGFAADTPTEPCADCYGAGA